MKPKLTHVIACSSCGKPKRISVKQAANLTSYICPRCTALHKPH